MLAAKLWDKDTARQMDFFIAAISHNVTFDPFGWHVNKQKKKQHLIICKHSQYL